MQYIRHNLYQSGIHFAYAMRILAEALAPPVYFGSGYCMVHSHPPACLSTAVATSGYVFDDFICVYSLPCGLSHLRGRTLVIKKQTEKIPEFLGYYKRSGLGP